MTQQLTEESIAARLDEEPAAAQPEGAAGDTRDSEYDYERTPRHRPFRTHRPDGSPADEEDEDEADRPEKKGGVISKVLILLGAVVFLVVVLVCLVYFLGRNNNQTQVRAGSPNERPGAQRELDQARQEADEARKAVTEAAQPKQAQGLAPAGGMQPSGDLSLPISPDPLATSGYAPNAVAPPVGGAGATPAPSGTTAGSGSPTAGSGPGAGPRSDDGGTARGGGRQGDRDGAGSDSAAQPGSFYFFPDGSQQGLALASNGREPRPGGGVMRSNAPGGGGAATQFIKPPFGALLPVRLLDSLMTLRAGGAVRLATTREVAGPGGWKIPRGTVVSAKLVGGDSRRAYLAVDGLLDAATNRIVNVGGEVKGTDGAPGLLGQRKRVNSTFKSILKEVARSGVALGSAFLVGRRGGSGYIPTPQVGLPGMEGGRSSSEVNEFLYVPAGAEAYVLVTDRPATAEGRDAAGFVDSGELSDEELTHLITEGTPEQIRAALPRMNPDLRRLAETILAQEPRQ